METITAPAAAPARRLRDHAVDLVKTVAICDVLLSHVAVPAFSAGAVGSPPWLWALFWASISHVSVSLFLMASGTLLLNPERPTSLKKLYAKNFPRLLAALLFWAACYKLFGLAIDHNLTLPALLRAGKELVLFRHEEHLYYLHIMLLVYAFLPLTELVSAHADRRQLRYLLGLWFLLGIVYPTVKPFWPFTLLVGIPQQWLMNMTYASIGYTLLGRYLTVYGGTRSRRFWILTALTGFGAAFGGSWVLSGAAGKLNTHFLEGMGAAMCLGAVGVYGLCRSASVPVRAQRALEYISKASFCVFLTHIFFLKLFAHFGVTALAGPAAVTVPAMTLLLLGCSCGVYEAARRIPVVNRWLI
jgi:surface polysaccharide O-acyltransferase-like enzyme